MICWWRYVQLPQSKSKYYNFINFINYVYIFQWEMSLLRNIQNWSKYANSKEFRPFIKFQTTCPSSYILFSIANIFWWNALNKKKICSKSSIRNLFSRICDLLINIRIFTYELFEFCAHEIDYILSITHNLLSISVLCL